MNPITNTLYKQAIARKQKELKRLAWTNAITTIAIDTVDVFATALFLMLFLGYLHGDISKQVPAVGYVALLFPSLVLNWIADHSNVRNNGHLKRTKEHADKKRQLENLMARAKQENVDA